jgi:hypothetical protein
VYKFYVADELRHLKEIPITEDKTYKLEDIDNFVFVNDLESNRLRINPFSTPEPDKEVVEVRVDVSLHYADERDDKTHMAQPIFYNNRKQEYSKYITVIEEPQNPLCTEFDKVLNSACRCGDISDCGITPAEYCCYRQDPHCKRTGRRCNDDPPILSLPDIRIGGLKKGELTGNTYTVQMGTDVSFEAIVRDQDPGVYKVSLTLGNDGGNYEDTFEETEAFYYATINTRRYGGRELPIQLPIKVNMIDRDGNDDTGDTGIILKIT